MALRFPQDLELYGKNDLHENLQSDVLLITGVSRRRKTLEDFIRIPHEEGFFHVIEAITKLHHNITWQMVYVHDITTGKNPSAPLHTPLRVVISKTLTEGLDKLGGKNPACWLHLGHGQELNGVFCDYNKLRYIQKYLDEPLLWFCMWFDKLIQPLRF